MPRLLPLIPLARVAALAILAGGCVDLSRPPSLVCPGAQCGAGEAGVGPLDGDAAGDTGGGTDGSTDAPVAFDGPGSGESDARAPDGAMPDVLLPDPEAGSNLASGVPCGSAAQCASGFCVDGVCCQTACTGLCQACNQPSSVGTCSPVPAGEDPGDDCAGMAPSTCRQDGFCDGNGACRLFAAGTTCEPATCTGAVEASARTCDGLGTCRPALTKQCDPYKCAGTACATTCAKDEDCGTGSRCEMGACSGLLPNGAACTEAAACLSGHCVDGVCCQTACDGTCQACNLPGSTGVCAPVPAGEDPADECAPEAEATCGKDGVCDGRGSCRLHPGGTVCAAAACEANVATPARTCDGMGTCQAATPTPCNGYVCAGAACVTACTSNADCVSPNICVVGTCRPPKALGVACGGNTECASGFCEQGVCCGSPCSVTCYSCALPGKEGTCTVVAAGEDPLDHCAAADVATCGLDGTCNGAGGCRRYPAGTTCAAATCSGTTFTPARTCDGAGTCVTVTSSDCAPYTCDAMACRKRCSGSQHCVANSSCVNNACASPKKANGDMCAAGTECLSGFCAQGVCCNAACTGTCQACNLAASSGTCTNVPAGEDPLNQCTDAGASSCGDDGACNGAGACRKYPLGTVCAAASCTSATATPARTCDGAGTCQTVASTSCGTYQCSGTACRQSCGSNADCVAPSICSGGACGGLKGQYYSGRAFDAASLKLTRVDGQVNFEWGQASPGTNVPIDNFCVRWTGKVIPRYSQTYTFHAQTDDGVRVWVNNTLVVDHWFDQASTERTLGAIVSLQAGQAYDIRMEYYEAASNAVAKLLWSSSSQAKEIIPTSRLIPAP